MVEPGTLMSELAKREAMLDKFETTVIKPLKAQIESLRSQLHAYLIENKMNSISTDHGRAHLSTNLSIKVEDKESWLDFVFEHDAWDMLTKHVAAQAVQDWHDTETERAKLEGAPVPDYPPGLRVEQVQRLNVALKNKETL